MLVALALLAAPAAGALGPEDTATDDRLANEALRALLATPLGQALPRLPWKVDLIESWQVNAYSNGRGRIAMTRGLAGVLGGHEGVWAAAIAHELAHGIMLYPAYQPQFEAELRKIYLASGFSPSDPAAQLALRVAPAAGGMFNLKGDRRTEFEADRLGVLMMAEAGFHPDFALALDRLMRSAVGDQTKYSEFMLSHPRWANREQETEKTEGVALAIFNHAWPDAARSPGGQAPPLGHIQSVTVSRDAQGNALLLRVRFELKNAGARPARIAAVLLARNRKVRAARAEYRAPDGSLALNAPLTGLDRGQTEATLRIPYDAFESNRKKLVVALFLAAGDWADDLWFQPVKLPRRP